MHEDSALGEAGAEVCELQQQDADTVARLQPRMREVAGLADLFKVLADDTRVKLLYALAQQELCVCDLAAIAGLTVSNTSHHLRLMRDYALIKHRKGGRMVYYSLADDHVVALIRQGLEHVNEGER